MSSTPVRRRVDCQRACCGLAVRRRAARMVAHGDTAQRVADARGHAEVGDFHFPGEGDHDVAGLEVAVRELGLVVRVVEDRTELFQPWEHLLGVEAMAGLPGLEFREGVPIDELHDDGGARFIPLEVVSAHDAGMHERHAAEHLRRKSLMASSSLTTISGTILMATAFPSLLSRASSTTPIPPRPISRSTW